MRKPLGVLIVEDSEDDALLAIHALKKGGYDPVYERVEDAVAMEEALRKKRWDVILCDYQLPKFNGLAAVALLKESRIDTPLIIVSGAIGEETAVECMRLGARDYIMKGNLLRLPSAIERELEEMESRRRRKQAEEALQESEENYRNLFDNANEAIFVVQEGKLVFLNPMTAAMTGYAAGELTARPFSEFIHPDDRDMIMDRHNRRMRGEDISHRYSFRITHRDGDARWVELNVVLIQWKGKPATLNFLGDVSERKWAEEEKHSLEERLQRAEKMEALGTLAGGVAHDLNNVLGVIVGYGELLLDSVDKSSPLRRGLDNIMSGGLKAAAIVDDLLTLARRGVPGRKVLNLNKIIVDCQQSPEWSNLSFYNPALKIKTDLNADLLNISGSFIHLAKTLYNLLANASEAMAKGGLVTIKTTNQYLDKPIQGYDQIREGDYVVLSVTDTGEGIHPTDLKRIFEPFYTKKIMGRSGTGLGLAVVWGTVKDHHGYINVESEAGEGSTFTLYFPVTREETVDEGVAVPISEYMGKGEAILVVDDVKEQRELAASMLMTLNYNVESVSSGEDAVAYIRTHKVELIILDMIMDPGMDGLDTYRGVLAIRPQQKAIIVSGFSESDRVRAARDFGAGAYVRKPYIKERLGLAVRREIDRPEGIPDQNLPGHDPE
ncbi:MAG: response regulator [Syntrophales bacterium]|jgi:PAS domain S-box-containing protein